MVGTGVFVYTAVGAGLAGPAVLASLLIAGIAAACNGLSSAELAAAYPRSGGTYEYAGRLLSPWAGFLAGWMFLAAKSTSAAATALGFGAYVGEVLGLPPLAVSLSLVVAVTALNFMRLARAGALNLVLVAVTVAALGALVITGLPAVSCDRFRPFAPRGASGILSAAALLFVAYAGYARVATLGEEIEDPRRNIPRAVVLALVMAAALYVLVTAVAVGTLGADAFARAAEGGAPLVAVAGPPWVKTALAIGAASAMGSVFLNLMLGLSRMAFAMSRGRDLPVSLATLNRAASPVVAVVAVGLAVGALVAAAGVVRLLSVSAFTVLVYYGLTNVSALRLERDRRLVPAAVPWAGLAFCLTLAASISPRHVAVGAAILLSGVAWRLAWTHRRRRPAGP
jgi:APA family basic amino acid/polyamine antiporter